jgi:hypothetical protein
LFHSVLSKDYLRRNIFVRNGNKLSPTVNKICAEQFNDLMRKEGRKEGRKKERQINRQTDIDR